MKIEITMQESNLRKTAIILKHLNPLIKQERKIRKFHSTGICIGICNLNNKPLKTIVRKYQILYIEKDYESNIWNGYCMMMKKEE